MTGRQRTIFEGLAGFNFHSDVVKTLKFNSYFKKLGFERVNLSHSFNVNTYYPQLTLMICPSLVLTRDNHLEDDDKGFVFTKSIKEHGDLDFDDFQELLSSKKGYIGLRTYSIIKRNNEEIKPIIMEIDGKEYLLGHYLKERNIVFLYISPFNTDYSAVPNEYQDYLLNIFEEKMKGLEVKKVDVSEKLKMVCIEKYKTQINNHIENINSNISNEEDNISNWRVSLINSMRSLQLFRKQVEGLISFSANTDEMLKKGLEEIKTLSFVKEVKLTSIGISVDIGEIKINYKGDDVYIGDFYVVISPDRIKIFCKNPVLNNDGIEMYHPHIDRENNCYGGEKSRLIDDCLADFELKKVIFLINLFLKSYTSGDSYSNISIWTRKDVKRKTGHIIKDEDDIMKVDFQGDYFHQINDRGEADIRDDDDNSEDISDDNRDDDYYGECSRCGDDIYQEMSYVRNDNDDLFCCRDCMRAQERGERI